MERGIRNILTFVKRSSASKIFGKITLKPLLFPKASSSPRMTEQIQILLSSLDGLKRLFSGFREKPSSGVPELCCASFFYCPLFIDHNRRNRTVRRCALFAFKAARIAFSNTQQQRKLRWTFSKQIYCFRRKLLCVQSRDNISEIWSPKILQFRGEITITPVFDEHIYFLLWPEQRQ